MPTVSIIMAVHNAERFLAAAVESVLAQSFGDFEFIIVDDGSSDDSGAILRQFAKQDDRIHLIARENRGLTCSLNEMIAEARGEFLARMDADDLALPQRLAVQVKFMQEHPDVVLLGGAYELIDEAGRALTTLTP